jgi:hypothetical protein
VAANPSLSRKDRCEREIENDIGEEEGDEREHGMV